MTKPFTNTERTQRRRALATAGIAHASGWIHETDRPEFEALVKKAKADVKAAIGEDK